MIKPADYLPKGVSSSFRRIVKSPEDIQSNTVYKDVDFFMPRGKSKHSHTTMVSGRTIENVEFHNCILNTFSFWGCVLRNIRIVDCRIPFWLIDPSCTTENVTATGFMGDPDFRFIRDESGERGVIHVADEDCIVWKKAYGRDDDRTTLVQEFETHPIYLVGLSNLRDCGRILATVNMYEEVLVECLLKEGTKYVIGEYGKCRAEALDVVSIWGKRHMFKVAYSARDTSFAYRVGHTVKPDNLEEELDINQTCAPGVHFFFSKFAAARHQP